MSTPQKTLGFPSRWCAAHDLRRLAGSNFTRIPVHFETVSDLNPPVAITYKTAYQIDSIVVVAGTKSA